MKISKAIEILEQAKVEFGDVYLRKLSFETPDYTQSWQLNSNKDKDKIMSRKEYQKMHKPKSSKSQA